MKKGIIALVLILGLGYSVFTQQRTDLLPVPQNLYAAIPRVTQSLLNTGEQLPESVDFSPYIITPRSQGPIGSCGSWAVSYELIRIEKIRRGWSLDKNTSIFSPSFLYNQVNGGRDNGSTFYDNLNLLVTQGCATIASFPYTLDYRLQPDAAARSEASKFKIDGWNVLNSISVNEFKKWLSMGYGIICTFIAFENIDAYQGGIYNPEGQNHVIRQGKKYSYHGMLITGYDNATSTFKVINSWGSAWGEKGYMYIHYNYLPQLVQEAYVITPKALDKEEQILPPNNIEASKGLYMDKVSLSWERQKNASGYEIFRLEDGIIRSLGRTTDTQYDDATVSRGKSYFYYIKSYKDERESVFSTTVEGWTKQKKNEIPGIPQELRAECIDDNVHLQWRPVPETEQYMVYCWDNANEIFVLIGTAETNEFTDGRKRNRTEFLTYFVIAANSYGKSLPSMTTAVYAEKHTIHQDEEEPSGEDKQFYKGPYYQLPVKRLEEWEKAVPRKLSEYENRITEKFNEQYERTKKNFENRRMP